MTDLPNDIYQPETLNRNATRAVLIVTADNTEDLEFFYPYYRFIEAGFKVDVATPNGGAFAAKHGLGIKQTRKIGDVTPDHYDMLYIPGGKAPAQLRENADAIELTKAFAASDKPIAAICHGPQLLAAAAVIIGKQIAAWPECEQEVRDANAIFVNKEMVTDGLFVTARWPGDLPAHMKATLAVMESVSAKASRPQQAA
jgi:protease I